MYMRAVPADAAPIWVRVLPPVAVTELIAGTLPELLDPT